MPTEVALKRARKRKFKAKERLSFGSSSSGSSSLPSHMKADLPDLFARLEVQQKAEEDVPRCDDSEDRTKGSASNRCSTDEIVPTTEKAVSEMRAAESSPYSIKSMDENEWEDGPRKSTTDASSSNFEGNLIKSEEAGSDALTDSDAVDIATPLRKALKKNGPFLEELLSARSKSQVQYVIYPNGALTAFMDLPPGFELAQEGRYIFLYYEDRDAEECDCSGSSYIQDEPYTRRYSRGSSDGVHQHADDGEPERERCSSSCSRYYESFVEEQFEEEKHRLKDASCLVPLSPPSYPRGVEAVQETSDADAQTKVLDTSQFREFQSTLQSRDADVTPMKERLENLRQNKVGEVQQLKTEQLLKSLQAVTPQYVVKLKNRTATKEEKMGDKNRAGDKVSPPQQLLPLRQGSLPPRLRPEDKLLMPSVERKFWPM
ncbi:hypothetical protein MTO96_030104 [Rhipicephalus appendiculatus]